MDLPYYRMYIGGELKDSGKYTEVICPATGKPAARVAKASAEDAEEAIAAARKGFAYWSHLSLAERSAWMEKLRDAVVANEDRLREAIMNEMGKTYDSSYEDYEALINTLRFYPYAMKNLRDEILQDYEGTHTHRLVRQPAGVAVAYLAWNFPILNLAFKLGPALAAGCSIIIKPSSASPVSAYIVGEILDSIGFPAGVVNILSGSNGEVSDVLTKSRKVDIVTMIGSTPTGLKVIADSTTSIKKISMELGGNAPFIIFDDADYETALDTAINLKFGNCGQVCVSANRIFVHESIYERFVKDYVKKASSLKLAFGKDSGADMGPLVSAQARERIMHVVEDALQKGAKLECGGKIPADKPEGYWYEPTVFTNVDPSMEIYSEEIFGPLASITPFSTDDEVLEKANAVEAGLASYIFTGNAARIQRFSEELQFGEVQVNGVKYSIYLPHGGIKNSGIGHDCSYLALNDYLITKRITTAR